MKRVAKVVGFVGGAVHGNGECPSPGVVAHAHVAGDHLEPARELGAVRGRRPGAREEAAVPEATLEEALFGLPDEDVLRADGLPRVARADHRPHLGQQRRER